MCSFLSFVCIVFNLAYMYILTLSVIFLVSLTTIALDCLYSIESSAALLCNHFKHETFQVFSKSTIFWFMYAFLFFYNHYASYAILTKMTLVNRYIYIHLSMSALLLEKYPLKLYYLLYLFAMVPMYECNNTEWNFDLYHT